MSLKKAVIKPGLVAFVFVLTLALLAFLDSIGNGIKRDESYFPGMRLNLTAEARYALQNSDLAFPSNSAGFSAYYRRTSDGSHSLDKDAVDDHIFSPIAAGEISFRAAPAQLVSIGDNYTVAAMSILNIDGLTSPLNIYYDDEGWIVAYLPKDAPSSQVWQAREEDLDNPAVTDISITTLLDAINVVVNEALGETAIEADNTGLGYYHWQHQDAENFLMMAVSRADRGEYPVQFSVPDTLTVTEVASTLWISQGDNTQAPCANISLDDAALIAEQCQKGIFSAKVDLSGFGDQTAHNWKLTQSERDEGGSGALLIILYSAS